MAFDVHFTVRFKAPRVKFGKWTALLDRMLSKQIKKAGAVWLNASVMAVVPIWSGASRATFLKLARALTVPLTITGITPQGKKFSGLSSSRWGPRIGYNSSTGKVSKGASPGVFTFTYGTTLWHLVFNEYNDANASPIAGRLFARLRQPGPYSFQELGKNAFLEYTRHEVILPSPWRRGILTTKSIRRG